MFPQKSALPQSVLPLSQGSQPEVAELETGHLTQGGKSREASEASSRKNDEVTEDLKTLLHEV